MITRSTNQVSTASEFIFSPPEKVSIRILGRTHQPLYIQPQELNTEISSICSTARRARCSLRHITFRTKLYITLPCFGRQSATNDLATTPTQFPPTDRMNSISSDWCRQKARFNSSAISTCKKATLLQGGLWNCRKQLSPQKGEMSLMIDFT